MALWLFRRLRPRGRLPHARAGRRGAGEAAGRKDEEAGAERDRLIREAYDGASEFLAVLDGDGRLLEANRTALALGGVRDISAPFRGGFFWDAPWWAHSATLRAELRAAVTAAASGEVVQLEAVLPASDGTTRYFDLRLKSINVPTNAPARSGAPGCTLVIAEGWDVTRLRKAEHDTAALAERLHRRELLGAAGRLAGGVAHDFNNLLAAIVGSIEVLRTDSNPGPRGQEALAIIAQAAEAAAKLTVQLLAFGRPRAPGPWVIDPTAALARTELVLRRVLALGEAFGANPRVALEVNVPPDAWPIRLDAEQLEQVLVNLAVNARDAMPEGGRLLVELTNVVLGAPRVFQTMEAEPGEYLQVLVRDTGTGMRNAVLDRIFEPFFTTKEVGKGTGLGLSVVYGIVRQSGGYIEVSSRPGAGTEMRLLFPRARMLPVTPTVEALPTTAAREHILLVEDQPAMRASARDLLESLGYEVEAYPDGESALAAAGTFAGLDLLISDVALPGCSGLEVADRLRIRWPGLEVLLVSNHGDHEPGAEDLLPRTHFVQGPLSASVLAARVRTILDRRSGLDAHGGADAPGP